MDCLVGNAHSPLIRFIDQRGQPMPPDVGSVSYTLYDHSGVAIGAYTNVAVSTNSSTTSIAVNIGAPAFTIANGLKFEKRILIVKFTRGGLSQQIRMALRVIPLLIHTASPQGVRELLGINANELADEAIDLVTAYFEVEDEVTKTLLDAALTSGTTKEVAANQAILARAALNVLPSLRHRIAQKETDGMVGFDRPEIKDFDHLHHELTARYGEAVSKVTGRTPLGYQMAVFTQPVDPITGV